MTLLEVMKRNAIYVAVSQYSKNTLFSKSNFGLEFRVREVVNLDDSDYEFAIKIFSFINERLKY